MSWLVDENNNQFVGAQLSPLTPFRYALIRPSNPSLVPEDVFLLHDFMMLLGACFIAGYICKVLRFGRGKFVTLKPHSMPCFIGYVFAGTLLGPAGYNAIVVRVDIGRCRDLLLLVHRTAGNTGRDRCILRPLYSWDGILAAKAERSVSCCCCRWDGHSSVNNCDCCSGVSAHGADTSRKVDTPSCGCASHPL